MKTVTLRGVDSDTAEKLKTTAKSQGKSINQLAINLIKEGLGLKKEKNILDGILIWTTCSGDGVTKNSISSLFQP